MKCLVYNWESMRNLQLEYVSDVLPETTRSITMISSSSSPPYAIHGLIQSSHIWASARCAAASRAWFLASALRRRKEKQLAPRRVSRAYSLERLILSNQK